MNPKDAEARALTFGRNSATFTHVHVNDDYCSAAHCRVVQVGPMRFTVEDLGSSNGTWIANSGTTRRVYAPTPLAPGDRVRIGRTTLPWEAR